MSLAPLQEQELAYSKPRSIDKPLRDTSISKWLESLYDYLIKSRGVNKFPLAYVVRYQVAVKPHAMDPATDYENIDQEITSRSPHDQYVYGADNKNLWHILHDALKYHQSYTSIRSFARTQNGRSAYLALTIHNLGESRNHTVLKEEEEENLNNVFYTEEKLKFTFD